MSVTHYNRHILDFCIVNRLGDIKLNKIGSIKVKFDALLILIINF